MNSLVALQGQKPQIDAVGQFAQGQAQGTAIKGEQQRQAMQSMQNIGAMALGVMGGDLNGTPDPQRWEQALDMLGQNGIPVDSLRGRPELAPLAARGAMTAMQQLQNARSEEQMDLAVQQFERSIFESDRSHSLAQQQLAFNQAQASRPQTTDDIREYEYAQSNGYEGSFADFMNEGRAAGATQITVGGEGNKFWEAIDSQGGQMFADLLEQGVQAGATMVKVNELDRLLSNVDTGAGAAFQQFAGNLGIDSEGLSDLQAAQAIINQLVPQQRPAGSGPMSDADLELFKQSMPRLINQPGGNRQIIDTMKGIAEYTQQQGNIAAQVANRQLTPQQGREALAALENPLANVGQSAERPQINTPAEYEALPSGTTYTAPDGSIRRKP